MRGKLVVATALLCLCIGAISGFSQAGNAQLSGVVTDQSGALIPGVMITVTNASTGVVRTAVTNEAGAYNLQGIQPGRYTASASLPGFQTHTYTNMELSVGAVSRQNFQLQIATQATTVEVSVEGLQALTETSSVGDVLTAERIKDLPLVGTNVLDLLNILPGVRFNGTGTWLGDYANTVAGQGLNSMNVTLDGLPTRDERFSAQAGTFQGVTLDGEAGGNFGASQAFFSDYTGGNQMLSTTNLNPDLVGEIKLILAPVDAELGRGNSQIQMTTRSGTNRFTGAATWNIQNTSLNPNTWNNNNNIGNANTGCKIQGQTPPCWNPTQPNWRNTNEYTVSFGGPLIRNKTFFFALWNQQISNTRLIQNKVVLSDAARNGIFRYWEGWVPGNAGVNTTAVGTNANPTIPAVDFEGNPLVPTRWPNGAPYGGSGAGPAGRLVCFSVFGTVKANGSPFGAADCPSGTDVFGNAYAGVAMLPPAGAALWDTRRPTASQAALGYFNKFLQEMPRANDFTGGDGLNSANLRWLLHRSGDGAGIADAIVGAAQFQNRKQFNLKIDQNWGAHRLAGGWTHQYDSSTDPASQWPNGLSGTTTRGPQTVSLNVTSTLSSSMLNEGRFGLNLNTANATNPWNLSDSAIRDKARSFMLQGGASASGNGSIYPVLISPAAGGINLDNGLMFTSGAVESQFSNPLYNFADTFSWTRGTHSFRFGGDFRFPRSKGNSLQPIPVASYGNLGGPNTESPFANVSNSDSLGSTGTPTATNPAWISNVFPQNARNTARDLAYILTNSLGSINTPYWAENYSQVSAGTSGWQDVTTQAQRHREMVFTDYSFFAKDDWKLTRRLTLNLGVRYEYYSPPYITSGLTSTVVDQGYGLFGAARGAGGALFDNWLSPGNLYFAGYGTNGTGPNTNGLGSGNISLTCSKTAVGTFASRLPAPNCDPSRISDIEFIGPNSPNPGKTIIPRDRNNFGPAIGFAWQVPWFGDGKTTVRGGYQITYQRVNIGEGTLASALGGFLNQSANQNDPAVQAIAGPTVLNRALLLSDLPGLVPVPPSRAPGQTVPVYGRSQSFTAFDPQFVTPYTQNITMSVTRSLSRAFTMDVRYVGNLSRKLPGSLNLNTPTTYYNQELFDAFSAARRGENPRLLDEMLAGLDLAPGVGNTTWNINGVTGTYPTDRLYGPVGTCSVILAVAGSQTPSLPGDPRCPAGQSFNSGAEHLRRAAGGGTYSTGDDLANGNFANLAAILAGTTNPTGGLQLLNIPVGGVTPSQRVRRNGCDRIANGLYNPLSPAVYPTVDPRASVAGVVRSGNIPTRCFPENYLIQNPQLNNATYNANLGRNNYHSMELQFTMRPINGFSWQANYTWAKSMGLPSSGFTDPLNREFDRQKGNDMPYQNVKHDLRSNGTFELPIGPNKLLMGNSDGWLARVIERWKTGFIVNMSTGSPASVTGVQSTRYSASANFPPYGNARFVPTEYWKIPTGKVKFGGVGRSVFAAGFGTGPDDAGTFFGVDAPGNVGSYTSVLDPQCSDPSQVTQIDSKGFEFASNASTCTMRALVQRVAIGTPGSFLLDPRNPDEIAAQYVLVNPKPGEYGILTPNVLTSFGFWSFDANIQKSFAISDSKQLTFRIDATNVLNHPQPFIPVFSTSTAFTQFGIIECGCQDHKSGTRTFQGQVRLQF